MINYLYSKFINIKIWYYFKVYKIKEKGLKCGYTEEELTDENIIRWIKA